MIIVRPDFAAALPPQVCRFDRILTLNGEVYRAVAGRKTLRFSHAGKTYFLKVHLGVGWKEIFKNLVQFRLPVVSANTEWRALHRLKTLGIQTTTPAAYGCEGRNPARQRSFLITEDLGETITLEDLFSGWNRKDSMASSAICLKRALLKKIASIARTMHQNGVNHRDFYLCHLRAPIQDLHSSTPQDVRVYVMDLHRAQLRRHTPTRWVVKDLAALYFSSMDLGLTQRDRYRFMKIYSGRPLRNILSQHSRFWGRVQEKAVNLYRKIKSKSS